ncbi:recombination protein F [Streptomyces sp. ADI95-16]|uniref:AAA family ATPase n=1 Tax=Streptomyces sp. ADI95-16 TaxID=1522758 RepID=UPI000F3A82FB|nr:AAA family ATPase [Streptomyces sp. ADI95-16]AYV28233.1 recombination protein F [Streptomyces sp. ADI95-16]
MTETEQHQQTALPLAETVATRLAESALTDPVKALLRDALGSGTADAGTTTSSAASGRVYLDSLAVNGFRGIGPRARLSLTPRPGVNLVVGRNGSGKSSLAEAIEVGFTGTRVHRPGQDATRGGHWYNLHNADSPKIELKLAIEGDTGNSTLIRTWTSEEFGSSAATFKRPGHGTVPLIEAGWDTALADHRPFLSYTDLDLMLTGKPSERYDAIATILGMELLSTATNRLSAREKALAAVAKETREALPGLRDALYALEDDDRAVQALLAVDTPGALDLDTIDALAAGLPPADDSRLAELRSEAGVQGPDLAEVEEAVRRLRIALADVEDLHGTDAENAWLRADLLEKALAHADRHPDDDVCPACGTERVLGREWCDRASRQVAELRREAKTADDARAAVRTGARNLQNLIEHPQRIPAALAGPWKAWTDCRQITDPAELARRAEEAATVLANTCDTVRTHAVRELEERDERWRALVIRLAAWADKARETERDKPLLSNLRKAVKWLKDLSTELREQRMERFTDATQAIWERLRQESNVDLTAVSLKGSEKANVRKLVMAASVDGQDAPALDVMSQGELHSLALSLFLPRATTADSPFGFLVIDDPVQSMDPTKVHGLAQVLHEIGRHRQIVVFTHDPRLQKAFTDQELPVTVFQVTRGERSRVKVDRIDDPVAQAIGDARAIAATRGLPPETYSHVLPGLCRIALENAFLEAAWIRHHRTGGSEHDLQAAIDSAERFHEVAAFALFGDVERGSDVREEVRRRYGSPACTLIHQCQKGAHPDGSSIPNPHRFVTDVEALAQKIRKPEVTA